LTFEQLPVAHNTPTLSTPTTMPQTHFTSTLIYKNQRLSFPLSTQIVSVDRGVAWPDPRRLGLRSYAGGAPGTTCCSAVEETGLPDDWHCGGCHARLRRRCRCPVLLQWCVRRLQDWGCRCSSSCSWRSRIGIRGRIVVTGHRAVVVVHIAGSGRCFRKIWRVGWKNVFLF